MGEAKQRGSFEQRKKSSIHKKSNQPVENFINSENFKISYSQVDDFSQVFIVYSGSGSEQQIVLSSHNREELALMMIQFGFAYMGLSNQLFSLIAPEFHQPD